MITLVQLRDTNPIEAEKQLRIIRDVLDEEEWGWLRERMRYYRRPLRDLTDPLSDAGFVIERICEPTPSDELKLKDPKGYETTPPAGFHFRARPERHLMMIGRHRAAWGGFGALALSAFLGAAIAAAQPSRDCGGVPNLGDGWEIAAPEEGFDLDSLCALGPHLAALKGADPHGIVVVRHGKLVYETYFAGEDQRWPQQHWNEPLPEMPHDARTKHDVQSITKSVTALLVGIALDHGEIKTLDTSVLSFFPGYTDLRTTEKLHITVRDLLTMSTGLSWPYKPYLSMARQMDAALDPFHFVLEQPMVGVPGEDWHYNNGSAELLGAVLHKATGVPLDQFAKRALFDPLAIEDWEWGKMANGDPGASWGLRLRPRDLAKIGQLMLNRGTWHGRRVVSSGWIEQMIAPHVVRPNTKYGYLWWLSRRTVDGRDIDVVSGIGWGGQYLDVVPSLDLVVVVTAGLYDFEGKGPQGLAGDAALDIVLHATKQ